MKFIIWIGKFQIHFLNHLRLELAAMKSDNTRLWQAFDEAKLLSLGGVIRSRMIESPDVHDIRVDLQGARHITLKN